jgi:hypothetical protein
MTKEIIELVSNNLETVKTNKIKFEIDLIHSCDDGSMSKEGVIYELEHMFDKCITIEDVINTINLKDFDGEGDDEDMLFNIKSLVN